MFKPLFLNAAVMPSAACSGTRACSFTPALISASGTRTLTCSSSRIDRDPQVLRRAVACRHQLLHRSDGLRLVFDEPEQASASSTDTLPSDSISSTRFLFSVMSLHSMLHRLANIDSLAKVCAGRIRTNVPTPGYNIQPLFRILPQHTVALKCTKALELPQTGFLRGNQY